jgi:hypothetical protein
MLATGSWQLGGRPFLLALNIPARVVLGKGIATPTRRNHPTTTCSQLLV